MNFKLCSALVCFVSLQQDTRDWQGSLCNPLSSGGKQVKYQGVSISWGPNTSSHGGKQKPTLAIVNPHHQDRTSIYPQSQRPDLVTPYICGLPTLLSWGLSIWHMNWRGYIETRAGRNKGTITVPRFMALEHDNICLLSLWTNKCCLVHTLFQRYTPNIW